MEEENINSLHRQIQVNPPLETNQINSSNLNTCNTNNSNHNQTSTFHTNINNNLPQETVINSLNSNNNTSLNISNHQSTENTTSHVSGNLLNNITLEERTRIRALRGLGTNMNVIDNYIINNPNIFSYERPNEDPIFSSSSNQPPQQITNGVSNSSYSNTNAYSHSQPRIISRQIRRRNQTNAPQVYVPPARATTSRVPSSTSNSNSNGSSTTTRRPTENQQNSNTRNTQSIVNVINSINNFAIKFHSIFKYLHSMAFSKRFYGILFPLCLFLLHINFLIFKTFKNIKINEIYEIVGFKEILPLYFLFALLYWTLLLLIQHIILGFNSYHYSDKLFRQIDYKFYIFNPMIFLTFLKVYSFKLVEAPLDKVFWIGFSTLIDFNFMFTEYTYAYIKDVAAKMQTEELIKKTFAKVKLSLKALFAINIIVLLLVSYYVFYYVKPIYIFILGIKFAFLIQLHIFYLDKTDEKHFQLNGEYLKSESLYMTNQKKLLFFKVMINIQVVNMLLNIFINSEDIIFYLNMFYWFVIIKLVWKIIKDYYKYQKIRKFQNEINQM